MLRRLATAVSLACAAACVEQTGVEPSVNVIIVHAILDAAAVDQYVIVQQSNGSISSQAQVKGAVVTLALPDGTVLTADQTLDSLTATPRYDQPRITVVYRFALGGLGVALVPGGTYRLRVATPDGQIVTGNTTLPTVAPDTASGPSLPFDHTRDTLSMSWARVPGARSYEVLVRAPTTSFTMFVDTSVVLGGLVRSIDGDAPEFVAGATQQVVVHAVDANYYDYYRRSSDFFTESGLISHLSGGLGLFGSIVPINSRTVIVR